ncbi:uncharacterized protein LOC132706086 isoform X2 [Cylas formicarius]|nr:uncharacterized protein LOC132706086 isoform X2 [Cylas formicarius]
MYCERVRLSVKSSLKERPNCHLGKLIANRCYGIEIDAYNIEFLFTFIKNVENPSIESADILRSYAHIVSRNYSCSSAETINSLTQKVRENFAKPYSDTVVFEIVLLFEVLSEVSGHDLTNACLSYSIWEDSLVRICENLERPASASHDVIVSHKSQKIKEALINVILQFMLRVRYFPQFCNKEKIFRCLCAIIETSNMKRPTVLSAELINALASSMDGTETDKNLKITFLDRALRNIAQARSTQILSIRKNPAARLPVHALCVSDRRPGKPLLSWTVNQLLDILSDPNSSHSSIASALYCAEVLISDNTMYNSTLPHIPDFISHCVHLFLKPSWTVRNADLQLTKALIDRFYGVVIGSSLRPKTIEHLLLLFPQLASRFCNVLSGSLTDSCLIVMEFISEAHIRKPLFENSFFELTRGFLLRALFTIIETNSHDYGLMAVKAYAALCREDDVPSVFCGTVEYLIENLLLIRSQRTLRNFLYLLQGLYEKSRHKKRMNSRYRKLTVVARDHLDSRYVSFLSFKSSTLDEIETSVDRIDSSKYDSRIWQNNYLPYWLNNAEDEMLGYVLQKMLRSRVSDCVQSKLLSVLVAKYSKSCINDQVWRYVASALVSKVVEVDDSNIYLLLCYLKVVLLLKAYVTEISDDLLNNIRFSYESVNHHYKSFVYVIALASRRGLSISDQRFIKLSIKRLKNLNFDDEEVSELTSEILPSLYKCTWCSCTRLEVHKMALLLLLRHGLTDFIDFTSGSKQRSAVEAAATLLSCKNLLKCLGCRFEVLKFTEFVWNYTSLPNSGRSRKSNSYFTSRNETHVDEKLIHKMVFKLCVDLKSLNK